MDKEESFGVELAKQFPVKDIYNDLAHPALSEIGKGLQGATKIALTPISALVWGYEKIADYLDVAIPEYFEKRKIEKEKITTPDPAVAVPLVEAMRYTSHKPELREMFTNLLGASMNSDINDDHPSFVEIIKQLSSDECKIIRFLHTSPSLPIIKIQASIQNQDGEFDVTPYFSDVCYATNCQYPEKFPEYLDNLHRLGIVEVYYDRFIVNEGLYEKLKDHPSYPHVVVDESLHLKEKKSVVELNQYGKKFCKICLE